MESCPRGRRCETRNFVSVMSRPRVRIPNSPPYRCKEKLCTGFYIFTIPAIVASDVCLEPASTCEYMLAVVL